MHPLIRDARAEDITAMNAIYGHYVEGCTCTWEEQETQLFSKDSLARRKPQHPAIVAEVSGKVRGWATLSPYNLRTGWRFVGEDSVFIHPESQGKGLGKLLLAEILLRAKSHGLRKVIARISGDQPASLGLHAALGFAEVGRLRKAGFKSGQWLDCVYMERDLEVPQP